jgi:hypothetical protein
LTKTGRYIPIGYYKNVKIGYGTINYIDLKTIYIKFNSWLLPEYINNYDLIISKTRNNIKRIIYNLNYDIFNKESIVDLDIRTNGIKAHKKSFMNLEVTLFIQNKFEIKSIKPIIKEISKKIVDNGLTNKQLFNFYIKKLN